MNNIQERMKAIEAVQTTLGEQIDELRKLLVAGPTPTPNRVGQWWLDTTDDEIYAIVRSTDCGHYDPRGVLILDEEDLSHDTLVPIPPRPEKLPDGYELTGEVRVPTGDDWYFAAPKTPMYGSVVRRDQYCPLWTHLYGGRRRIVKAKPKPERIKTPVRVAKGVSSCLYEIFSDQYKVAGGMTRAEADQIAGLLNEAEAHEKLEALMSVMADPDTLGTKTWADLFVEADQILAALDAARGKDGVR